MWVRNRWPAAAIACVLGVGAAAQAGSVKAVSSRKQPPPSKKGAVGRPQEKTGKTKSKMRQAPIPAQRASKQTIKSESSRNSSKFLLEPDAQKVVEAIIQTLRSERLCDEDIAFVLAAAQFESQFDPRAKNKRSTALGILQWIRSNRQDLYQRLGFSEQTPFRLCVQLACLRLWVKDMFEFAGEKAGPRKKGTPAFYLYAYGWHHDGAGLGSKGMQLARRHVLPKMAGTRLMLR